MSARDIATKIAGTVAEIRQGQRSTPSCEPPGEYDIEIARGLSETVIQALTAAGYRILGPDEVAADTARLDFLDALNRRLNSHYGTDYRWKMVINHNVNRLMLKFPYGVDLNDAKAHGFQSCRDVIDREMTRIAAGRSIRALASGGEQ